MRKPVVPVIIALGLMAGAASGSVLSSHTSAFDKVCFDEQGRIFFPAPEEEDCPEGTVERRFGEETRYITPIAEEDSQRYFPILIDEGWAVGRLIDGSTKYEIVMSGVDANISVFQVAALDLEGDGVEDLVVADTEAGELLFYSDIENVDSGNEVTSPDQTAAAVTDMTLDAYVDGENDVLQVCNSSAACQDLSGGLEDVSF